MTNLERIPSLARWLHHAASLLIVALPLVAAFFLARSLVAPAWLADAFPGLPPETALTPGKAAAVVLVGAFLLVPMLYALAQMRALFALYRRGEVLTDTCARHIGRAGAALGVLAALQVVVHPLQVLVLTADNPPGGRQLSIALTGETLWLAMAAGLLVVIGRAMAEAARIAEENRGFV